MHNLTWLLMLTPICAVATPLMAADLQLIDNGGFESGEAPDHWRVANWRGTSSSAIDATVARSGRQSLRLTGHDEKGTVVANQHIGLLTRDALRLTGFWRSDVNTGTGARIVLRWTDQAGNKIQDEPPLTTGDPFDWQPFELTAVPPDNAAAATVFLEIWESRGNVWYDDVSAVQTIEPPAPGDFTIGRSPGIITAAVFDANGAGGRAFGAGPVHDVLSAAAGIDCQLIADLSLKTLARYDCIVLPNVHHWGGAAPPAELRERPELAWAGEPRACLRAYLRIGGGLLLTHQSNGTSPALSPPILPQIVTVPDKTLDVTPAEIIQHPITEGIETIEPTFTDARILQPGPAAKVFMRNEAGNPLLVAGRLGPGRVVGIGLCPGIDADEQPVPVSEGEARLLANAVRWAAADETTPCALTVAPDIVELREPDEDIALTLSALPAAPDSPDTIDLTVVLLDEAFRPVAGIEPASARLPCPGSRRILLEPGQLQDGTYYPALLTAEATQPQVIATVSNYAGFARFADSLPKCDFQWTCMNVHGPGGLKTEDDIAEMARLTREMNFSAVLFAAKPPNAYLYYDTKIGEKAPGFDDIDPLKLAVKHCHRHGLQLLVQFCTFREGSASNPSKFISEHPEYADWNPGDGPDITKHQHGVFGCPDRPEVREYELALLREIAENYDIDGISFDYIRYKNDRWCVCPYSKQHFEKWWEEHPDLTRRQARARHAEEQIVSFTWQVRDLLDEVKPEAILHGYVHPTWANKFPLNYLSFRASAHGDQPGRGGMWSLERVFKAARRNVDLADDHVDFMTAAPMADTAYLNWAKSPDRFRRELRLIHHAGAPALMVYPYSTLRHKPDLRAAIAEELAR